jgi:hypothetical protein
LESQGSSAVPAHVILSATPLPRLLGQTSNRPCWGISLRKPVRRQSG